MGIHPHGQGFPKVHVHVTQTSFMVNVVLDLQELNRFALLLPAHVVVQLQGERHIGLLPAALQKLQKRPLRLVEVTERGM
jgi:hypothetical protein